MLCPGPVVDAHAFRLREVVALAVRVDQRAAPLPVFGRGLGVDDQRVGVGPLQDCVVAAAMRIRAGAVGEGETVGRAVVILMLLAARDHGVGEALVQPLAAGARNMRHQPVEDPPAGGVGVEAPPDEIADRAARLRAAVAIGPVDAAERIAHTLLVAQPAHKVAHGDVSQAHHQRVAAFIDQLVDPARPEAPRQEDMAVGRRHAPVGAEPVQSAARVDAREGPFVRRHGLAQRVRIGPHGEACLRRIEGNGGMGARRAAAAERQAGDARLVGDELGAHGPGHGSVLMARDRQVQQHPALARQEVALPGAEDDRVAAAEEEAVAGMGRGLGVVAVLGVAEILERALVAPVAPVEEEPPVAERGVRRLQYEDIGAEGDQPVPVPRREPQYRSRPPAPAPADRPGSARGPRCAHRPRSPANRSPLGEGPAVADLQLNEIGHGARVLPGGSRYNSRPAEEV